MKTSVLYIAVPFLFIMLSGCSNPTNKKASQTPDISVETDMGTMIFRLYDETPLHRDNFIKLVENQFYDSILFHRVIETFMIQTGDPTSKNSNPDASLGDSDLPYTIPAEFTPTLFHKKGALGAARDGNPERASSSTQFYIVQGRVYSSDSLIEVQEKRINGWLAMNRVVNDTANKALTDRRAEIYKNYSERDSSELKSISEQLDALAKSDQENNEPYMIPEDHRKVYRTIGGTPHLDQNYTVFGEVVSGLDVVDKIAAVSTNDSDRPIIDIKIINTMLIDRKEY